MHGGGCGECERGNAWRECLFGMGSGRADVQRVKETRVCGKMVRGLMGENKKISVMKTVEWK